MRNAALLAAFSVVITAWFGSPLYAEYLYYPFDYPGQTSTVLTAINNSGQIAGTTKAPQSVVENGMLTDVTGKLGPIFSVPGVALFTYPTGIDDAGEVIGRTGTSTSNAFLRAPNGTVTLLPMPVGVSMISHAAISGNGGIVLSYGNSLFFKNGSTYTPAVVPGPVAARMVRMGWALTTPELCPGFTSPPVQPFRSYETVTEITRRSLFPDLFTPKPTG